VLASHHGWAFFIGGSYGMSVNLDSGKRFLYKKVPKNIGVIL
jgi:hypothetical protein